MSLAAGLRELQRILEASPALAGRGTARAESELLLAAALRDETGAEPARFDLYARGADPVPAEALARARAWARRRAAGELLQHLTGRQFFLNHDYRVSPHVLVPRPETEGLVVAAIERLAADLDGAASAGAATHGLEIGLGSGVIAIELLHRFPGLAMTASELAPGAEAVARANADQVLGSSAAAARLRILRARDPLEVWEPFAQDTAPRGRIPANFLIANPPYLLIEGETDEEVARHEPASALFNPHPDDPIYFYRRIAERAAEFVRAGGWAFLEIPPERAAAISEAFRARGWVGEILRDLPGRERVLAAHLKKEPSNG